MKFNLRNVEKLNVLIDTNEISSAVSLFILPFCSSFSLFLSYSIPRNSSIAAMTSSFVERAEFVQLQIRALMRHNTVDA